MGFTDTLNVEEVKAETTGKQKANFVIQHLKDSTIQKLVSVIDVNPLIRRRLLITETVGTRNANEYSQETPPK